jgi:hypothetical protein
MCQTYKFNLFKDERDIWTESSLSPFINIEPIYIQVDTNKDTDTANFEYGIFKLLAGCILDNDNYSDELEFGNLLSHWTYENFNEVMFPNNPSSESDLIKFLIQHKELSIYQISTGKYWSRVYISLENITKKDNMYKIKGSTYTDEEITEYIKDKLGIYD